MTFETRAERRSADRRSDGFTAKILQAVFAMRRGFGNGAATNLLLRNGHDEDFIARVLTIPEERRGLRRRGDGMSAALPDAPPAVASNEASEDPVTLDAAGMALLHRLRFEADSGMHRITIAECPAELRRFGLIEQDQDGPPTITAKGRQALRHFACVRALDSLWCGAQVIPMRDDIRDWLEVNLFLQRDGGRYAVTELGERWLKFNCAISSRRTLS